MKTIYVNKKEVKFQKTIMYKIFNTFPLSRTCDHTVTFEVEMLQTQLKSI